MRTRLAIIVTSLFVLLLTAACPGSAEAQIVKRLKDRAKDRIEQKIGEKQDKIIDQAMDGEEEAEEPEEPAKEPAEQAGQPAPAPKAADEPAQLKPGQGAWANFDFVPGERILFAEDFSKDRVGNFPQRFELVSGNAEIVEWDGRRWLRTTDHTTFRVPLPDVLPTRFTVEFDATIPWTRMGFFSEEESSYEGSTQYLPSNLKTSAVIVSGTEAGVYRGGEQDGRSVVDPRDLFQDLYSDDSDAPRLSRPFRVRMQVDGKYIKLYLNEKRVSNMPNGNFGRNDYLVFQFDQNGEEKDAPLITNFSINAGGTPMYDALMSDGRFSTQGILFDTGSDRLRPESTPTLKEIGDMLTSHPELRVMIEGHTDNVGKAESNQTLSEKRAAAVRDYLVATYKVDTARLESKGFGPSKPSASNDTPEGRQQNRRVELVKL